jgi:hypothetical protein
MRNRILLAALLLVSLVCVGFARQSQSPTHASWEYKVEKDASEKRINELGADGWKLIAVSRGQALSSFYFERAR